MRFSGTVALVAGAGGGMGLNIANDLIRSGVHVGLADIKPRPDDICDGPGSAEYHQGDLTDPAFVQQAVKQTVSQFGQLNYLVNTTGVLWFDRDRSLLDLDLEVWDRVMDINLKSLLLTSRLAIPEIQRAGGGAIVHVASIDALGGDPKPQDAYGASKAAVLRLSKSIAVQFAGDGIRSNALLPGPVLSPLQERWRNAPELQAQVAEGVPLGRIGTTQDLANACLFLLSDESSFITGTELIVDGGISANVY